MQIPKDSSSSDLYIILDLNSKFIKKLNLNALLQSIRVAMGLQLCLSFHNAFNFYGIDTYSMYKLYESNAEQIQNYNYQAEFERVLNTLIETIKQKGSDDNYESKIVQCLAHIMCKINRKKVETKILLITSKMFQLNQQSYHQYLSICNHCQKNMIRIDLIEINQSSAPEIKNDTLGVEGLKLGIQLTKGIVHEQEYTKMQDKLFSQFLLSAFNPGESMGFQQPKMTKLAYKAFCYCCNKVTGEQAFACSNCLAIQCEKQKKIGNCAKCNCIFV